MNDNKAMKDEHEFDSWRYSSGSEYVPYYPPTVFPYQDTLPSSQAWSNGPETQMTFLSGYEANQQHSGHYAMEAMFGSQNTYGFGSAMGSTVSPFNAFFPSNSDPFWSNSKRSGNLTQYRVPETDSYNYHHSNQDSNYQISDGLKHVESGIQGLTLDHIKADQSFSKSIAGDNNAANSSSHPRLGPFGGSDPKKFDSLASSSSGPVGQIAKKTTWASIASQPAKPQPKSLKSKMSSSVLTGSTSKHLSPAMETIGTWDSKNGSTVKTPPTQVSSVPQQCQQSSQSQQHTQQQPRATQSVPSEQWAPPTRPTIGRSEAPSLPNHPVLDKLRVENNYNPKEFDLNAKNARFFIIKSYSEDDIHRSIKYSIWCSTEHGNKRLDSAFKQLHERGNIYLLFSVNGSGHFCGMAQMVSHVDYSSSSNVWAQDKWKGQFRVKWIYVKDVPNAQLRHIRLENNENKPVTNSRDTQEVPFEKGKQVIKIMHHYRHTTSIFDDFLHYEKRQEEESQRRVDPLPPQNATQQQQQQPSVVSQPKARQQQQQQQQQWKN